MIRWCAALRTGAPWRRHRMNCRWRRPQPAFVCVWAANFVAIRNRSRRNYQLIPDYLSRTALCQWLFWTGTVYFWQAGYETRLWRHRFSVFPVCVYNFVSDTFLIVSSFTFLLEKYSFYVKCFKINFITLFILRSSGCLCVYKFNLKCYFVMNL